MWMPCVGCVCGFVHVRGGSPSLLLIMLIQLPIVKLRFNDGLLGCVRRSHCVFILTQRLTESHEKKMTL